MAFRSCSMVSPGEIWWYPVTSINDWRHELLMGENKIDQVNIIIHHYPFFLGGGVGLDFSTESTQVESSLWQKMVFKRFIPSRLTHFFGTVLAAGWCHDLSKRQAASIWWNLLCDHRKANGRRRSPTLFGYVQSPVSQCFTTLRTWWISFFNSGRPLTNMTYKDPISIWGSPHIALAQSFQQCQLLLSPLTISESVPPWDDWRVEGWWHLYFASDEANLERDALWDCNCIRSKETFCFKAWWPSVQRLPTWANIVRFPSL